MQFRAAYKQTINLLTSTIALLVIFILLLNHQLWNVQGESLARKRWMPNLKRAWLKRSHPWERTPSLNIEGDLPLVTKKPVLTLNNFCLVSFIVGCMDPIIHWPQHCRRNVVLAISCPDRFRYFFNLCPTVYSSMEILGWVQIWVLSLQRSWHSRVKNIKILTGQRWQIYLIHCLTWIN